MKKLKKPAAPSKKKLKMPPPAPAAALGPSAMDAMEEPDALSAGPAVPAFKKGGRVNCDNDNDMDDGAPMKRRRDRRPKS